MTPIAKLLFEFIQRNLDNNNQIKMSNNEIASHLGVHAMSISKGVKQLKDNGLVDTFYSDNLRRVITLL